MDVLTSFEQIPVVKLYIQVSVRKRHTAVWLRTERTSSTKEAQPEEDPSVAARLQRLQNNYEDFGMRRTVEGVLVVHDHGHPHILMLQIANAFFKLYVSSLHLPSISIIKLYLSM